MSTSIEIRNVIIGGTGGVFIEGEVPGGTINGVNTAFSLASTPNTNRDSLYLNGVRQKRILDYTLSSNIITFVAAPIAGDVILMDYNY